MDDTDIIGSASDTVWPPGPTRPDIAPLPLGAVAAAAAPRVINAEWALWGKEANETSYHVLRCSKGALRERDFSETVTRYSPGELDALPQYTVSWIPGANKEPEYVALGVHEVAPDEPRQAGGRSRRDAVGREIVYVRLFCLRYAELAKHERTYQDRPLGYQDLVTAAAGIQLPAGRTEPVKITLPQEPSPIITRGPLRKQAEHLATVLLTGRQVCVVGADEVTAGERLRFIDTVMALLPYGMRVSMSAATLVSSTSQDLKLRLFFASVQRSGGSLASGRARAEDHVVTWGKLDEAGLADQAANLYKTWLKDVKGQAPAMLAELVVPVRFTPADIRRMVGNLPQDKPVHVTLDELGRDLRAAELDIDAVRDAVKRLSRYLAGEDKPADPVEVQRQYRRQVCQLRLLADDARLSSQLKGQLYEQLLRVAFGPALTYDGYRDIEESVGFPLHASLRTALARFPAADWLAYLLAREAQQGFRGDKGFSDGTPVPPGNPLDEVIARIATRDLQQRHGTAVLDWTLRDLRRRDGLMVEVLAARLYLAPVYAYLYHDEPDAQAAQLKRVLAIAFGGQLSRPEIDMVLSHSGYPPTPALGAAVMAMTGRLNHRYAQERLRQAQPLSAAAPGAAGPRNHALSARGPWAHPKTLATAGIVVLAVAAVLYLIVVATIRGG